MQNNIAFMWDKYCYLTLCLHLIEPNYQKVVGVGTIKVVGSIKVFNQKSGSRSKTGQQ